MMDSTSSPQARDLRVITRQDGLSGVSPRIVPFEAYHLLKIKDRDGIELDRADEARQALAKESAGPAWTAIAGNVYLGAAGIGILWPGVGEAWANLAPEIANHRLWFHRTVKRCFRDLVRAFNLHRVQATVRADSSRNCAWLVALGFVAGPRLRKYGADKSDYLLYAWVESEPRASIAEPQVVPFRPEHLQGFEGREGEGREEMEIGLDLIARFEGFAWSFVAGGRVIGAAGVATAEETGYGWMTLRADIATHALWLHRTTGRLLQKAFAGSQIERIRTTILKSSERNRRWVESLGFSIQPDEAVKCRGEEFAVYVLSRHSAPAALVTPPAAAPLGFSGGGGCACHS